MSEQLFRGYLTLIEVVYPSSQPSLYLTVHPQAEFRFRHPSACPRPGGAVEAGSCQPGSVSGGEMRINEALGAKSGPERKRSGLYPHYIWLRHKPHGLIART
jgi:hypothetical protein